MSVSVDVKGFNGVSGRGRLTCQHGTCSSQFIRRRGWEGESFVGGRGCNVASGEEG